MAAECWLRHQGLPFFVVERGRRALLLARIAPFLITVLAVHLAGWLLATTDITIGTDDTGARVVFAALAVGTAAGLIAVPLIAFSVTARLLRTRSQALRPAGLIVVGYFLLVDPWLLGVPHDGQVRLPIAGLGFDVLVVAGAVVGTWAGAGSIAAWAARTSIRQLRALGEMSTRALPLLMLVVFFSFFTPAIWAVTNSMTVGRLAGVAGFFALLGLLFILPITRSELRGVDERINADQRVDLIERAALAGLVGASGASGPALGRLERLNLHTVLVLAQGVQVAIFSSLIAAFLVLLGVVALPPPILVLWLGGETPTLALFGVVLPVSVAVVKTAVFLSCVSSLNFLVSAASNAAYKSAFYDPLFGNARMALAVRSAYRALKTG